MLYEYCVRAPLGPEPGRPKEALGFSMGIVDYHRPSDRGSESTRQIFECKAKRYRGSGSEHQL